MFEKVPRSDTWLIDCSEFYQIVHRIMRHFPEVIMRFRIIGYLSDFPATLNISVLVVEIAHW